MNKKSLKKFSLITAIIGIFVLAFAYFFFHYVTDDGITFTWHKEVGKPFVSNLIGTLGVLFIWTSLTSLIASFVFFKKEK